jgi:glucose-1-phosphatase
VKTISTVIFDIGGVLINIDPGAFPRLLGLDRHRPDPADEREIKRLAKEYETGRIGTDMFFGMLDAVFKGAYSREQLSAAWNAIVGKENSAIAPIVDAIQSTYQTAILSNTNLSHQQRSAETAAILQKFSKYYLSYNIGFSKPDPAIYRFVIADLSVAPASILFIDDIAENAAAALECGMQGLVFHDASRLSSELRSLKIL